MEWLNGFADRVLRDEPLSDRIWYKLGGAARYFFSPANVDELRHAMLRAHVEGVPVRVLGAGANLLVRDEGFDGLVLRLDAPAFTQIVCDGVRDGERVVAGGGADLMRLVRDCSYEGLCGLECLAGVPGTVGGATVMNAGGRFGQFGDVVESVRLLEPDGTVHDVAGADMGFGYRSSAVGDRIVLRADLRLQRQPAVGVRERFKEIWQLKMDSQPFAAHSAGCVFRNPPNASAGKLIDECGLKGAAHGKARVSRVHGNFIEADEGATAGDVLSLVERVRRTVLAKTGIALELEIAVW